MSVSLRTKMRRYLSKLKQEAQFARLALSGNPVYAATVNLEDVLIGEQCGTPLERWVGKTGEWDRASRLLKDSPYVEFLSAVSDNENLIADDDFLERQPYFRMAQVAVRFSGSYFGAKEPGAIRRHMRGFYETFVSIREGRGNAASFDDYRHSAQGEPLLMSKVRDSDCFELSDGHHRAAVYYMLGQRQVATKIVGTKHTYLQQLVRQSAAEKRLELLQPVETADVRHWSLNSRCRAQLDLILDYVSRQAWAKDIRTGLDASCGYGWFVSEFRKRGIDAIGLTTVDSHIKIGRIAYGLTGDTIRRQQKFDSRSSTNQSFDVVLFFGAQQKPDEISLMLKRLDRLTERVLFLDAAHGVEAQSQQRAAILQHTSFHDAVPLGPARDGLGESSDPPGPLLFACIR